MSIGRWRKQSYLDALMLMVALCNCAVVLFMLCVPDKGPLNGSVSVHLSHFIFAHLIHRFCMYFCICLFCL